MPLTDCQIDNSEPRDTSVTDARVFVFGYSNPAINRVFRHVEGLRSLEFIERCSAQKLDKYQE